MSRKSEFYAPLGNGSMVSRTEVSDRSPSGTKRTCQIRTIMSLSVADRKSFKPLSISADNPDLDIGVAPNNLLLEVNHAPAGVL